MGWQTSQAHLEDGGIRSARWRGVVVPKLVFEADLPSCAHACNWSRVAPSSVRDQGDDMKTFRSVAVRIALYGGLIVLAATVWAWAVGANPWHGVAVGGVLAWGPEFSWA